MLKHLIVAILLLGTFNTLAEAQIAAKERMVIVISLDGFPGFALEDPKQPIPTLRRFIREGTSARMHTINPTITWPNHTTMVTGVHADEHGLLLKTRDADRFYLALNRLVQSGVDVESVLPADDDVNSVYEYLIGTEGAAV